MEQEELDARLAGAEHVPVHIPSGVREARKCGKPLSFTSRLFSLIVPAAQNVVEDDEEAQLKELQASLAM